MKLCWPFFWWKTFTQLQCLKSKFHLTLTCASSGMKVFKYTYMIPVNQHVVSAWHWVFSHLISPIPYLLLVISDMLYCRIHAIIFYLYINQPTVFLAQLSSVPLTMVWFQCLCSLSFMFDPLDHESLVNQRSSIFQVFNTSFLVSGLLLWLTSRCHYCFLFFPPFFPVLHVFSRIMSSTIFTREYIVGHQMPWPQPMKLKHMLTIQWKKIDSSPPSDYYSDIQNRKTKFKLNPDKTEAPLY